MDEQVQAGTGAGQAGEEQTQAVVVDHGADTPATVTTKPLAWWQVLLIRAVRASLQTFVGSQFVTSLVSGAFPTEHTALIGLKFAAGTLFVSLIQNSIELLNGLDKTHPELRA